jgi:hypothetical protein
MVQPIIKLSVNCSRTVIFTYKTMTFTFVADCIIFSGSHLKGANVSPLLLCQRNGLFLCGLSIRIVNAFLISPDMPTYLVLVYLNTLIV